jgi:hypothetical protein
MIESSVCLVLSHVIYLVALAIGEPLSLSLMVGSFKSLNRGLDLSSINYQRWIKQQVRRKIYLLLYAHVIS